MEMCFKEEIVMKPFSAITKENQKFALAMAEKETRYVMTARLILLSKYSVAKLKSLS